MNIEMWFDRDRSRITGQAPIGVVFDQIQLLDQGKPIVYSRGQQGDLQSKPGAGVLWKPVPDDPQGKLLPSYMEEAQSPTKGPTSRILVDGRRHAVSQRIVNRPALAERLIFFTDLSSGRIVRIENYHTVIEDGKKVELRLTGAYTLHYGPVDPNHFDLKSLRTPKALQPQLVPHSKLGLRPMIDPRRAISPSRFLAPVSWKGSTPGASSGS